MLPVLQRFGDDGEHGLRDASASIAEEFKLTEAEINEPLPSGRQTRLQNRIAWAHGYLKEAGLLERPSRGVYRLSQRGREVLASMPGRIDIAYLERFPEFLEFRSRSGTAAEVGVGQTTSAEGDSELTPDEQIREGYQRLRASLAAQLLDRVKQASPAFFESLVVEVLVAMGYGGSHAQAAQVVGRSGDGGIDGIIKQDRLGLENIYIQAKRWEATVGRPTIQQFAGALQGQRARKGVLITTSDFSREAKDYAAGLQNTIVLVSGVELAELMIDYGVGVSEGETLKLKKLDEDYFGEGQE
jgi:restriction system protein